MPTRMMTETQRELEETKQQVELELAQADLKILKQRKLLESGEILGDRMGYLYDDPRFATDPVVFDGHVSRLEDRLRGKNRPIFETEDELARIRGDGRLLSTHNEVGVGVLGVLTNFTIGTGYTYTASPKDKKKKDTGVRLVKKVQDWIDEFEERVEWPFVERELQERAVPDGEAFLQLEHVGGGRSDVLFREPDAVTEPENARGMDEYVGQWAMDWSFGIGTPLGRPSRPQGYFVDLTGDQRDWEYVSEDLMVHAKRNVFRNVKRGVSDYFAVAQELRRADKILRNTGEGAALQSAIAWIREHPPGTTGAQVMSLSSGKAELEVDRVTAAGNTRTRTFQRYLPGTILDVRAGQIYKPGPLGQGASFVDVSQAILRYVGVRWNMPEYLISSNAENSNFASALVSESPFVKSIEAEQKWYTRVFVNTMWKMLGLAIRVGQFSQYGIQSLSELKEAVTIEVITPRVSVRNHLEEAKIKALLNERGLLSRKTWSADEDLNYEHEQAIIAQEPPVQASGAEALLQNNGMRMGGSDREFQPQANEPGNVGKAPDYGRKAPTKNSLAIRKTSFGRGLS